LLFVVNCSSADTAAPGLGVYPAMTNSPASIAATFSVMPDRARRLSNSRRSLAA
jgi:hypothetical protein